MQVPLPMDHSSLSSAAALSSSQLASSLRSIGSNRQQATHVQLAALGPEGADKAGASSEFCLTGISSFGLTIQCLQKSRELLVLVHVDMRPNTHHMQPKQAVLCCCCKVLLCLLQCVSAGAPPATGLAGKPACGDCQHVCI